MNDIEAFVGMALAGKGCLYWAYGHPRVVGSWGLTFTDRTGWYDIASVIGACCDYHWYEQNGLYIGIFGGLWYDNNMVGCFNVAVKRHALSAIYWLGA